MGFPGGGRALDVGCGAGHRAAELAQHVQAVVGVDLCAPLIEIARAKRGLANVRYEVVASNRPIHVPTPDRAARHVQDDHHAHIRNGWLAIRYQHPTAACLIAVALVFLSACSNTPLASPSGTQTAPVGMVTDAIPAGSLTGDYVCQRPEANYRYPNSTEFGRSPQDQNLTAAASCTVRFASADDQQRIYDFYTTWLKDRGYHYMSGVRLDTDASARNFQKADCRQSVTLAVKSPQALRDHAEPPPTNADTRTVFEVTTLIQPDPICYPGKTIPVPPTTPAPRLP